MIDETKDREITKEEKKKREEYLKMQSELTKRIEEIKNANNRR